MADTERVIAALGPARERREPAAQLDGAELGARAAETGVSELLVLDLAVVGTGAGPQNLELLEGLKRLVGLPVYAGGGVRSAEDLKLLEDAGCDAALVGSAIHSVAIAPPG